MPTASLDSCLPPILAASFNNLERLATSCSKLCVLYVTGNLQLSPFFRISWAHLRPSGGTVNGFGFRSAKRMVFPFDLPEPHQEQNSIQGANPIVYRSATLARLKSLIYQAGLPPDTSLLEENSNSNRVSTIRGFHSPSITRVNRVDKQTCFQVHAVVRADQASNGRVARYMIARRTALLRLCLRVVKSGLFICQGSRVTNWKVFGYLERQLDSLAQPSKRLDS